jgi:hypothetical protein
MFTTRGQHNATSISFVRFKRQTEKKTNPSLTEEAAGVPSLTKSIYYFSF